MMINLALTFTLFISAINGFESLNLRIAGGNTASITDHPYIVSVHKGGRPICGGSIITKNIILTAAHCIPSIPRILKIRVGSNYDRKDGKMYQVISAVIHKNYKEIPFLAGGSTTINDIALLKLNSSLVFNNNVAPISMFNTGESILPGSIGVVSGWGGVPLNEQIPNEDKRFRHLRSALLPIIKKSICIEKHAKVDSYLSPGQICAESSTCSGDSGGPLVVNRKLAGIVSWGFGCKVNNIPPSVYAEIAYYRDWIDTNVEELTRFDSGSKPDYVNGRPVWD